MSLRGGEYIIDPDTGRRVPAPAAQAAADARPAGTTGPASATVTIPTIQPRKGR